MKNIVIYTTKKESPIKETLENLDAIEDSYIRIEDAKDLKEYERI